MQFPFDAERLGRLARRDVERACQQFLESCGRDATTLASELSAAPPAGWPDDLAPLLAWVSARVSPADDSGDPPITSVARLFGADTVLESPMACTRVRLDPGDEITEDLARSAAEALVVLPGEGDRLVSLDAVTFVTGTHLGYRRSDLEVLRARRMRGAEQVLVQEAWRTLCALREAGPDDSAALLEQRFTRLLRCPNHDMPATHQWLITLDAEARRRLWGEILHHVQRAGLPPGRVPTPASLRDRLEKLGLTVDSAHLSRLVLVADTWVQRWQPDPDVDRGHVQATREEIEEYLSWEPQAEQLHAAYDQRGVRFVNDALERLACGIPDPGWPEGLETELIEFRETFLRRLHLRPVMDLEAVDPARYLARRLARNRTRPVPDIGDPQSLLRAWRTLVLDLKRCLDPESAPPPDPLDADQARFEEDVLGESLGFSSAQEFFDIDDEELPTIDLLPEDDSEGRENVEARDEVLERVADQLEHLETRAAARSRSTSLLEAAPIDDGDISLFEVPREAVEEENTPSAPPFRRGQDPTAWETPREHDSAPASSPDHRDEEDRPAP